PRSIKQELQITSVEAVAFFQNTGPPTIPPQLFDMQPRPQGIVIREPVEEEDFLEQHSPDSVLFKTPEAVMQELSQQDTPDEIMAEQCAIEADLLAQRLKDAADTLAQASKAIPESLKMGNNQNHEGSVLKDAISEAAQKTTKTRTRKRPGLTRKEHGSKKQMTEERKVEAASLEWLPNDK
ncbi:hypothetical protein LINGRAHAP2_LOCUS5032, partial [Linum grandiflorum]